MNKGKKSGCVSCGYISDSKVNLETSEKGKIKSEVNVIGEDEGEVNPIIEAKCSKCGNNQAYFWVLQTRASDEASTRFFKCTKCKHVWREYK